MEGMCTVQYTVCLFIFDLAWFIGLKGFLNGCGKQRCYVEERELFFFLLKIVKKFKEEEKFYYKLWIQHFYI